MWIQKSNTYITIIHLNIPNKNNLCYHLWSLYQLSSRRSYSILIHNRFGYIWVKIKMFMKFFHKKFLMAVSSISNLDIRRWMSWKSFKFDIFLFCVRQWSKRTLNFALTHLPHTKITRQGYKEIVQIFFDLYLPGKNVFFDVSFEIVQIWCKPFLHFIRRIDFVVLRHWVFHYRAFKLFDGSINRLNVL